MAFPFEDRFDPLGSFGSRGLGGRDILLSGKDLRFDPPGLPGYRSLGGGLYFREMPYSGGIDIRTAYGLPYCPIKRGPHL